ncbi:unnamed protein product [Orchesella dallaii]|uniref:Ionotropic glutamate receptor L-glutamate and glycine-binding domain-containing protein n=1 Tax=Orchesella dallaii TaxID=48710 RepID=A0ABP1R8H5_9HEXA
MLPPMPQNATCESYYQNANLNLSIYFLNYFIQLCYDNSDGMNGAGGTKGVSEFLTLIANEYFTESPQLFCDFDTAPPDHFTHKLLPKASAFLIFVKDEDGFANILRSISAYPWWNKRARVVVMVKEKSLLPTKGILAMLEVERILNAVVVTEIASRENSTSSLNEQSLQQLQQQKTNENQGQGKGKTASQLFVSLQVVALDPYPVAGNGKESYVGRWANGELQTIRPIFQEKIDNLHGHKLKVCLFEFPPLVIKTEVAPGKYEYSGVEVDILKEFSTHLNFTYEFYEPPEGERWGTDLGNNTWTGLIGETQRRADFGFASVFLLDNRDKAVDVSTPYDQDQGCFGVPRPEALQHWLGLVLPFSWQVWACVLAMALVAGPTFTIITRPLGIDKSLTVGRGIFYALGSLVSTQKPPEAKSHALRTFIVSWLIFCWLACILYRVALIVSLTIGPNAYKIDSLKQLAKSDLKWGGYQEVLKTFSNSSDSVDDKLFERFELVTNSTAALERVATKGDFALLDSGKYLRYAEKGIYFNGHSSLIHVTKECPTRYNVGFVMPIGSPFLEKVNELIHHLTNAGLIDKWYRDVIHQAAIKVKSSGRKRRGDRGLDIDDLKLCLVLILCGHFCAFLSCMGEICLDKYRTGELHQVEDFIRKVSIISGLSSKGLDNPSFVITDTDDDDKEHDSLRSESLHSLPVQVECELCRNVPDGGIDPVTASLGDIKAISCPHIYHFEE